MLEEINDHNEESTAISPQADRKRATPNTPKENLLFLIMDDPPLILLECFVNSTDYSTHPVCELIRDGQRVKDNQ